MLLRCPVRHWPTWIQIALFPALGDNWRLAAALALGFLLGVGYGSAWGAGQWGPLAAWVAGAATFGAVVVALREASRSQRAREIDHEISRRRECIAALGDLWGAMVGQMIPFRDFVNYLDDLRQHFDPDQPHAPAVVTGPIQTYGDEIVDRIHAFFGEWASHVEPQLFTARLVLRGTPLYEPVQQVNEDANTIKIGRNSQYHKASHGRPPARHGAAHEHVAWPVGST